MTSRNCGGCATEHPVIGLITSNRSGSKGDPDDFAPLWRKRAATELLRRCVAIGLRLQVIKRAGAIEKFELRSGQPHIGVEGESVIQREPLIGFATKQEQMIESRHAH